jgi:hypothetical protein
MELDKYKNFFEEIKQETQPTVIEWITDKKNWRYDIKNDVYELNIHPELETMGVRNIYNLFKDVFKKSLASYQIVDKKMLIYLRE